MQRKAVYPGSFDPPTLGHLDIIERAAKIFEEVTIAIGTNSSKVGFLDFDEREAALKSMIAHLPNVKVDRFSGLLVDYCDRTKTGVIVRGLRAVSDFDYEFQVSIANRRMRPELDTVMLMTKWEYSYISSSVVREIATLGGDFGQFVPDSVAKIILNRLNR